MTFGAYKPGLLIDPAREYAGAVRLVDIGLEVGEGVRQEARVEALQHADVARLLPVPAAESDKYRRGVVGSRRGPRGTGAAVLAVAGALRGGAGGAVRRAGGGGRDRPSSGDAGVGPGPKHAGRVQAWVVGPGAGDDAATVGEVLAADVPVLIDADGLRLAEVGVVRGRRAPTLMTPHAGERRRCLVSSGRRWRRGGWPRCGVGGRYGATVLLKGSTTLVASAGRGGAGEGAGVVRVNPTGTPWLATAGSGDVLSGSGVVAGGGVAGDGRGSVAAYLHGLAGRFAAEGRR
ncbi:NAD(P)H-hydrate dehydratase [Streptomyces tendae]|uniref:NAD(P)H-hydrate dehydratase n=1 Tax=Streptomyces tendae TaxID=1932 RepID=UPI001F105105|nr:NAD(P)H-hydrate dehydratase [Streptomyces tendae]